MDEMKYTLDESDLRVIKQYWTYMFPSMNPDCPIFEWEEMIPLHPDVHEIVNTYFFYGHYLYRVPATGQYTYDIPYHTERLPVETARGQIDFKEGFPVPIWCGVSFEDIRQLLMYKANAYISLMTFNFFTNNLDPAAKEDWTFIPYSSRYECAKRGLEYEDLFEKDLLDDEDIDDFFDDENY